VSTKAKTTLSALVTRCRNGEKKAWRELIDQVAPVVFAICRQLKLPREESFDVFGEVSYLLLKNLRRLRSGEKVLKYVATMTKREIFAQNRKSRLMKFLDGAILEEIHDDPENTPDTIYEIAQKSQAIMDAMFLLPEKDYQLIKALFFDSSNPSYEKIAKKLNITVSSVGPYRARSLQKLEKILRAKKIIP